ncbi:cysteine proteinase inhibitor 1-like [Phoenix dactylifera]|uniref:Cysteine proteinase inhibitor 1-like n=1 Tax=Phoenix dactylifera TaxID=42345 RepID=A0A8B7BJA7_PHODC|nr:cysteine proteinase inhibitor 1-like [Phoenix dactylifera]
MAIIGITMKSFPLLLITIYLALGVVANGEPMGKAYPNGWEPIDPDDSVLLEIARFALTEHNNEDKDRLVLSSVVSGEFQLADSGFNYRVIIAASNGGVIGKYMAVVWEQSKGWDGSAELVSFQPIQA